MIELFLAISLHVGLGQGWNQIHPGIRYTDNQFTVGAFLNSESNVSAYATYTFENVIGNIDLDFGLATGYTGIPVAPIIRATVDIDNNVTAFAALGAASTNQEFHMGVVSGVEYAFGGN